MSNYFVVVGAGISGATIARLLAENLDTPIVVIDKRNHIAGNCYDYTDSISNITVHKYGSHIFHTSNKEVWSFINRFTDFNEYMHKVYAVVEGNLINIPFNFNSLSQVFPSTLSKRIEEKLLNNFEYGKKISILDLLSYKDNDLIFLSNYIYQNIFVNYTLKQWELSPEELDKQVTARVPINLTMDNRYFYDKYQGIPLKGYTETIRNMLNHPNIKLHLNENFNINTYCDAKHIFYTGAIDEFFDYKFGQLDYRSIKFKLETHKTEYYQNNAVINYPNNYDFTRIHEYKYYLNEKSKYTVVAKEFSEKFVLGKNDRYYPVINNINKDMYMQYLNLSKNINNITFFGRLGDYKYYDMDKAILRAINIFNIYIKN